MPRISSPPAAAPEADVWSHLRNLRDLPAFPAVINEINTLLLDPATSASDLSEVICRDQSLTAKLLKLVNAAYYGFHRQITGIRQAVALLGFEEVQSLALAASVMGMWDDAPSGNDARQRLWDHSLDAARIAREVALVSPAAPEVAEVFIAALLHDIGKVVLQIEFPQAWQKVVEEPHDAAERSSEVEIEVLGVAHEEVGAWLLDRWRLPLELVDAVRWHHEPSNAEIAPVLAAVLQASSSLAHSSRDDTEPELDTWELLGMEERHVAEIRARVAAGGWRS